MTGILTRSACDPRRCEPCAAAVKPTGPESAILGFVRADSGSSKAERDSRSLLYSNVWWDTRNERGLGERILLKGRVVADSVALIEATRVYTRELAISERPTRR